MTHTSEKGSGHSDPEKQDSAPQGGGEDENSSSQDGRDDHLHEDQKPLNNAPETLRYHDDGNKSDEAEEPDSGKAPV